MIVAVFNPENDLGDADFRLMINTFVTMFWRASLLAETITELTSNGYHVIQLDASHWEIENDLHDAMAQSLDFPDYYGAEP